jgi:hypothetical protein
MINRRESLSPRQPACQLVEILGLDDVVSGDAEEYTKNGLWNFDYAQNRYILYYAKPRQFVEHRIGYFQGFGEWVPSLKLDSFAHFKEVWGIEQKG